MLLASGWRGNVAIVVSNHRPSKIKKNSGDDQNEREISTLMTSVSDARTGYPYYWSHKGGAGMAKRADEGWEIRPCVE